MKTISIVIPVYNVEEHLSKCLDSVLNQTYKDLEIILVNDGSTDYSGTICEDYRQKDSRIKVYHQKNRGVSYARNSGLSQASGDYIGFVDADDWIDRNMYECLANQMEQEAADIAIGGVYINDQPLVKELEKDGIDASRAIELCLALRENQPVLMAGVCNKLFRRKKMDHLTFQTDLAVGEDMNFLVQACFLADKIVYTTQPVYHYIQRDGSAVHGYSEKMLTSIQSHKQIIKFLEEKGEITLSNLVKGRMARECLAILYQMLDAEVPVSQVRSVQNMEKQYEVYDVFQKSLKQTLLNRMLVSSYAGYCLRKWMKKLKERLM